MKTTQRETVILTKDEKRQILIGLAQIENGEVYSSEEVEKDIQQWLDMQ